METRYARLADLLELAGLLQSRVTGISIDQIADRFEVSRRTAERMLAALRDRFPEIEPELRSGHKYWRLPRSSRIVAASMPEEFDTLIQRVAQLEADIESRAVAAERLRAIAEDALGCSAVGIFVLDADFRVAWINPAIESYFGIRAEAVIGADMRTVIRERIRHSIAEPGDFEQRLIASYDDRRFIENLPCRISANANRRERWLEHWSQPIATGLYAGGRIEHYVDVTELVTGRDSSRERLPEITACALRSFRGALAAVEADAESALRSGDDLAGALSRVSSRVHGIRRQADLSLRLAEAEAVRCERSAPGYILASVQRQVQQAARSAGIRIETCVEPDAGEILADRMQLISALTELACEVIDAVPDGATVHLAAECIGEGTIRFAVSSPSLAGRTGILELPCSHAGSFQG